MGQWTDRRILDLFGIDLPIIQAPMAGSVTPDLVISVCEAGGLGSLPGTYLDAAKLGRTLLAIRAATIKPINVNFFAHVLPEDDPARMQAWRDRLAPHYVEAGLDPGMAIPTGGPRPFDEDRLMVLEEYRPEVVSFHFGLPEPELVRRVKATGAKIISSATTVAEARWLAAHGCDAVIAMGLEAGGHRGMFLTADVSTQVGTMALVPQVADAIDLPVIAAGGIADGRGLAAALLLGASAVQMGTAYLFTPEAHIPPVHSDALSIAADDNTAISNLFSGRPARNVMNRIMRELGPMSEFAPAYPFASNAIAPLQDAREAQGDGDFSMRLSGQAARLARPMPAGELTRKIASDARALLAGTGLA